MTSAWRQQPISNQSVILRWRFSRSSRSGKGRDIHWIACGVCSDQLDWGVQAMDVGWLLYLEIVDAGPLEDRRVWKSYLRVLFGVMVFWSMALGCCVGVLFWSMVFWSIVLGCCMVLYWSVVSKYCARWNLKKKESLVCVYSLPRIWICSPSQGCSLWISNGEDGLPITVL